MTQQVIVLEINEMPLKIFRHFQQLRPGSHLDELMKSSLVIETKVEDVDPTFLYPSQTWASLNTGAPYSSHKIHWYNDPKPNEYPLYWKTLANQGFSVGVVNSLHSSPAEAYAASNENYKFVIPDSFAPDSYTKPGLRTFSKTESKSRFEQFSGGDNPGAGSGSGADGHKLAALRHSNAHHGRGCGAGLQDPT